MPRVLVPKRKGATLAAGSGRDDPLDQLAKFIPAETLPIFALIETPLRAQDPTKPLATLSPAAWMWITILLIAILNIIYLGKRYRKTYGNNMPRHVIVTHYVMSTIAFFIYTYAVDLPIWGVLYNVTIAPIIVILYSAFAAFIPTAHLEQKEEVDLHLPP
jgi:hypothetical protein